MSARSLQRNSQTGRAWKLGTLLAGSVALVACGPTRRDTEPATPTSQEQEIIGGITDSAHWYVVMVGDSSGGFCSGTLISRRTVVTAGHCFGGITRVWFDHGSPSSRTRVSVADAVQHPGYDDASLANDLSLVKLSADAPVQAVPLLRETMTNSSDFVGPRFAFVGYGDSNSSGGGFGTRRVVTFPIFGVGPMTITHPGNRPPGAVTSIDGTQFYYRYPNKNTCTGDSGGPAFVVRGGVERHAGTTSYGDDNCAYDGVQAKTDATALTWIQQTIDSFEPQNNCRADGTCDPTCVSTSPAPLGTLGDPDCAADHCGADGVCVLSCSPVDADCASLNLNHCVADGFCQVAGCSTADPDCGAGAVGTQCAGPGDCASGFCVSGVCCGTVCSGACEACAGVAGTPAGTCAPKPAGTACRAAAGPCDTAESCSGASGQCPTDAFLSAGTTCRAAADACDAPETCSGTTGVCPADALLPAATVCRPAASECDAPESCLGATSTCPSDAPRADGTLCTGGTCHAGTCLSPRGDSPLEDPGQSGRGCGCTAGSAGAALWALLGLATRLRRSRRG